MAAAPLEQLRRRADDVCAAAGVGTVEATEALPGAGSAPGAIIPSFGVVLPGDHLESLRSHSLPVISRMRDGRTVLDLRSVDPSDDHVLIAALSTLRLDGR